MDVISRAHVDVMRELGGDQIIDRNLKYRPNRMLLVEDFRGLKIVYNGMTKATVGLKPEEYENCLNLGDSDYSDFFFRNYFMVPEDFDELAFLNKVKEKWTVQIDDNYLNNAYIFTILTTTACNARCFYCYEKGVKKKFMTIETADKIIDFIEKQYNKTKKEISLRWFGGEPTFNEKIIDHICDALIEKQIPFVSDITSNGYLIDEETAKKASEKWHLKFAQISIDGTEKVYNRAKNYIYDEEESGSPYQKVMQAVDNLLKYTTSTVSIRMNTDLYNSDDILKLVDEIHDRFGNHDKLEVYAYPLFAGYGINRTPESEKETIDKVKIIDEKLMECGYRGMGSVNMAIRTTNCMVDRGEEILFAPDGSMGLCEHYTESEFFGHIDDPYNWDWDMIKSFRTKMPDLEICKDCAFFSDCYRIDKCEDMRRCSENVKQWRLNNLRMGVIGMAQNFYNNGGMQNNSCGCGNNGTNLDGIWQKLDSIEGLLLGVNDKLQQLIQK